MNKINSQFVIVTAVSIALSLVFNSGVRTAMANKYPDDSIYTLDTYSMFGLVAIATALSIFVLLVSWFSTRFFLCCTLHKSMVSKTSFMLLDLVATVAIYLLMLVVVPQVFYTYYQWIFTGLPVQWVIKPISWEAYSELFRLQANASMADHLAGLVLWILLLNTIIQWAWFQCLRKQTDD